jgi:predicted MFS family arabinose efflux permease
MKNEQLSERRVLLLIGAVQFINVLDFMMVMPLGPDFAKALGISTSHLGWIGGSYTGAAALVGLLASLRLDSFARRSALVVCLIGLMAGTVAGGFAVDLPTLIFARVLAGGFGGPASALSLAIIADIVPPERRGKALGKVMGSFAVASVLGVPAGLELARLGGWRLPFFVVGGLGLMVAILARAVLPIMNSHVQRASPGGPSDIRTGLRLLGRPTTLLSFLTMATVMSSSFLLIPNVSAYLQFNLGYPRSQMGLLYLSGGLVSFVTMRLSGYITDRFGVPISASLSTALMLFVFSVGFIPEHVTVPIIVIFTLFMVANSARNVSCQALISRVPNPAERARFMSMQSAVQHSACAAGAFASAHFLTQLPGGKLAGIRELAIVASFMSVAVPIWLLLLERRLPRRRIS